MKDNTYKQSLSELELLANIALLICSSNRLIKTLFTWLLWPLSEIQYVFSTARIESRNEKVTGKSRWVLLVFEGQIFNREILFRYLNGIYSLVSHKAEADY